MDPDPTLNVGIVQKKIQVFLSELWSVDPDSLYPDPDTDPDPAFQVNPDTDTELRIRIQSGSKVLMTKN